MNCYIFDKQSKEIIDIIENISVIDNDKIQGSKAIHGLNNEYYNFIITDVIFNIGDIIDINIQDFRNNFIKKSNEVLLQERVNNLELFILQQQGVI